METLQTQLESYGVPCKVTTKKSGVFLAENFAKRDRVKIIHPSNVKVAVYGNKRARQAVLVFQEKAITHQENISVSHYGNTTSEKAYFQADNKELLTKIESRRTMYTGSTFKVLKIHETDGYSSYRNIDIEVYVPARVNCLLVGIDEEKTFICQLPEPVKSVGAAHKLLRPKDISNQALRIGEWFFDPVPEKSVMEILDGGDYEDYTAFSDWNCRENTVEEGLFNSDLMSADDISSENHAASFVVYKEKDVYVMGAVVDNRKTHKPVLLPGLCRVVRNRELITDSNKWD